MEPKVTFIIAHHNYQNYLQGCIHSALQQTYPNIHICVIDDCSTNQQSLHDIIKQYIKHNSEVTYVENMSITKNENFTFISLNKDEGSYGQAYARNKGMEVCWEFSDYFAILDADDENYPEKIQRCLEEIHGDNKICAAYTDTDIVQVSNNRIVREYREPYDYFRLMQECIVHSGCVIKKQALEAVLENGKVFDEDLPPCEDYDLWVRLAEKFLFCHIPESLVYVRVHPKNSTNTSTHEHRIKQIKKIFHKRSQRLRL